MQWTDESGSTYGNDPYSSGRSHPYGSGYGSAYGSGYGSGYECGASATTDTITMPWDPEQLLPWIGKRPGEYADGAFHTEAAWYGPDGTPPGTPPRLRPGTGLARPGTGRSVGPLCPQRLGNPQPATRPARNAAVVLRGR
ncbi:hypothetical protein GCM10009753_21710 [Streptantibioticus ferralitis]